MKTRRPVASGAGPAGGLFRAGQGGGAGRPAQKPVQSVRLFLALGAVEGVRTGRSDAPGVVAFITASSFRTARVLRHARRTAPPVPRHLDSGPGRRGAWVAQGGERLQHSDPRGHYPGATHRPQGPGRARGRALCAHSGRQGGEAARPGGDSEPGLPAMGTLPHGLAGQVPAPGHGRVLRVSAVDGPAALAAFRGPVQAHLAYCAG